MDVTPNNLMFAAMSKLVDLSAGEDPQLMDQSQGALDRRVKRAMMFDLLHQLVGISMREGVNRAIMDARARLYGPRDAEDRSAQAKAADDARANVRVIDNLSGTS